MTIRLTWEWMGQGAALDLANTITTADGREEDLLAIDGEYERWAAAESAALGWTAEERALVIDQRSRVLALRAPVRRVVAALADGNALPVRAVAELNQLSRAAPEWRELDLPARRLISLSGGGTLERMLAFYARDALRLAAADGAPLRRCPAPGCGMFYPPRRPQQRWCSTQCGTRARVARHYRARKAPSNVEGPSSASSMA